MNQINQYFLWPNCSVNCDFCIYRGFKKFSVDHQISAILTIKDLIHKHCEEEINQLGILLIGGEFFDCSLDNKIVYDYFLTILDECAIQYKKKKIYSLMIATSLIYDMSRHLNKILQYINELGLSDILMLNTSFDYDYRFKNIENLQLWEKNMKLLQDQNINVHTEMIVTHALIQRFFNNKFQKKEFEAKYHTYIDFIEPSYTSFFKTKDNEVKQLPQFLPYRKDFLRFIKENMESGNIDISSLFSKLIRARNVYYINQKHELVEVKDRWKTGCRRFDESGNAIRLYTYRDSDLSMIDDLESFIGSVI